MADTTPAVIPLPPITDGEIGGAVVQTVNGRNVHAYLRSKRDYSNWMKARIAKYGFVEGVDYITYTDLSTPNLASAKSRAQPTVEYALTLDMGRELGMVDGSEQGREIRRYFLKCEREAHARPAPAPAIPDWSDAAVLHAHLLEQTRLRIEDQRRVTEAESKALALEVQMDRLRAVKGSMSLRDAGKTLGLEKCDDIFEELHSRRWIYRRGGKGPWIACAEVYRPRYLDHRPVLHKGKDGGDEMKTQVVVTPKGLLKLAALLGKPFTQEASL